MDIEDFASLSAKMSDGVPQTSVFGSALFHLSEMELLIHKNIQDNPDDLVKTLYVNFFTLFHYFS